MILIWLYFYFGAHQFWQETVSGLAEIANLGLTF